jgi:hypothetical protein
LRRRTGRPFLVKAEGALALITTLQFTYIPSLPIPKYASNYFFKFYLTWEYHDWLKISSDYCFFGVFSDGHLQKITGGVFHTLILRNNLPLLRK